MPLTRYEIRNEYSLANPDLYRAAAKDDPEGLLEGVAMAGLVGIVRQLGDLAEFAAEVFHDLHEEVLATAARGHELLIRVQQLEAELPFVEKLMLAENNYVNFAYNPGLEWHANIHNDQNHFTQGDLPRFIRNAYEDCRGPPRLFLLDKFDVAGAGACLKRYTDPSFFRTEWASSELMKAEKEQQDKKARRIKKKGRRQRNGEMREAFLSAHIQPRIRPPPLEVENTGSISIDFHVPNSWHNSEQDGPHSGPQGTDQKLQSARLLIPEESGPSLKVSVDLQPPDMEHKEASVHSSGSSLHQETKLDEVLTKPRHAKPIASELVSEEAEVAGSNDVEVQKKGLPLGMKMPEDTIDFASETDNYVDALTTIDSEVETDSEVKTVFQTVENLTPNPKDEEIVMHNKQVVSGYHECPTERDLVTEDGIVSNHIAPGLSDSSEGREPADVSSPDISPDKETDSVLADDKHVSESNVSTPISGSVTSMPPLEKCTVKSEEFLESESAEGIPETPETPEANEYYDRLQMETLTSAFHQLPDPAVPLGNGPQSVFPGHLGSLSSRLGGDTVLPDRQLCAEHVEKDSFGDSESEASEGLKESSPRSSANSSIQPMEWAMEPLRHANITLDSDDELDGMQVSSSSSSSSSALSSPRPSMLATTFFENKPVSVLSPIKSSPEFLSGVSPESGGSIAPRSPVSLMEAGAGSSVMSPHHVQMASHISSLSQKVSQDFLPEVKSSLPTFPTRDLAAPIENQSLSAEEPEHFPPPPPLPPLEWRMTRRFGGALSSSNKLSEPSPRPPIPQKPIWMPRESLQAASLPPLPQRIHTQNNELAPAYNYKPSSTWHSGSKDPSLQSNGLERLETKEASAPQTDPMTFEASSEEQCFFIGELSATSARSKEMVQPIGRGTFRPHEAPVNVSEVSTSGHPSSESGPPLQSNDSTHSFRSSSTESPLDDEEQDTMVSMVQEVNCTGEHSSASPKGEENSIPSSAPHEISADDDHVKSSLKEKTIIPPPRLDQLSRDLRPPLPPPGLQSDRIARASNIPKVERKDSLIAAIAAHDKSTLRKVPEWSQSSRTSHGDDREVLLEQIRTGSFSLRRTKIEKQEAPRPVTNINVAAILEKANAIRQAFAGSDDEDEDDDWSDG